MPNGGVTKKTFVESPAETQLAILFDQQVEMIDALNKLRCKDANIQEHCAEQWNICDKRFKNIEKQIYRIFGVVAFVTVTVPPLAFFVLELWKG